jgi:alpha-tubulin suppressor-like RCC1 family protein
MRSPRPVRSLLVPSVVLAALACSDGTESPTAPAPSAGSPVPVAAATSLAFRQISAGGTNTCAVTTENRAYCWGNFIRSPTPVSGGLSFLEVSAGSSMACGITTAYRAYCWRVAAYDLVPALVPGGRHYRQISAGFNYACAVTTTDVAFCWGDGIAGGDNSLGQLGTGGGFTTEPTRVAGGHRWRRVFTAATHTCGTTLDNVGYCWGANVFGQLGSGVASFSEPKPVKVAGDLRFSQVKPGSGVDSGLNSHELDTATGCGITTEDRAYCWGLGAIGYAAGGLSTRTPRLVAGGRRYGYIHPGLFHTCALTLTNVAFCWGHNDQGQIGVADLASSQAPVRVSGGLRFVFITVAATGWHSCGVTASHQAYCWGSNDNGQLGDGTNTDRFSPVQVTGGT